MPVTKVIGVGILDHTNQDMPGAIAVEEGTKAEVVVARVEGTGEKTLFYQVKFMLTHKRW